MPGAQRSYALPMDAGHNPCPAMTGMPGAQRGCAFPVDGSQPLRSSGGWATTNAIRSHQRQTEQEDIADLEVL